MTKRILALLLCLALCLSLIPAAFAEGIEIIDEEELEEALPEEEIALDEPEAVPALPDEPEAETEAEPEFVLRPADDPNAEVVDSGTCGTNLTWTLYDTGLLEITGTGAMANYNSYPNTPPWYSKRASIYSVVIGEGVTSVGDWAFPCSNLTEVTLPDTLLSIGEFAFSNASFSAITLPDGLTTLGDHAFNFCEKLIRVTLGKSVISLGEAVFYGCKSMTAITVVEDNPYYSSLNGVLFDKEQTTLIAYPIKKPGNYTIPSTVSAIAAGAFEYASEFTSITIPSSVNRIGDDAFRSCPNLITVTLSEGLSVIGEYAFFYCKSLTGISIPASVNTIGGKAFGYCESLMSIEVDAANKKYSSQDGVLFNKAKTTLITFPNGVSDPYTVPSTVRQIDDFAFYCCYDLEGVTLPEGLLSIGEHAFDNNKALSTMTIPASVTTIKAYAFYTCSSLNKITFCGGAPSIDDYSFYGVNATAYYPEGDTTWTDSVRQNYGGTLTWVSFPGGQCGDALRWKLEDSTLTIFGTGDMWDYTSSNHPGWYDKASEIRSVVIEDGATSVGKYAFWGDSYTSISNISLPDGLVSLGEYALGFTGIKAINLPDSLEEIGAACFSHCESLKSISIPSGVARIEQSAFNCCYALSSVELQEGVINLAEYSFYSCYALTDFTFPESIKTIGANTFGFCNTLSKLTFRGSAPSFGNNCFQKVTATAYYQDDGTWTDDVKQNYGGTITWESLEPAELILYKDHAEIAVGQSEKLEVNTTVQLVWTSDNETAATVDENGVVTAHKYGKAKITCTTMSGMASASCEVQTLFWDVADSSKYYFRHVYWAAEKGITKGYNLEYFDPQGTCLREQMMTFLWRLAGEPKPKTTSSPFPDVKSGDYFYKAVLWGVEKKITAGFSEGEYAGKFGVGLPCTREQAMTFLWRMAGKPDPGTTTNPFSDIRSTDYFYKAVLWAAKNGIANGYADGTYGYGVPCLREHMVTFLSRYASKFM